MTGWDSLKGNIEVYYVNLNWVLSVANRKDRKYVAIQGFQKKLQMSVQPQTKWLLNPQISENTREVGEEIIEKY